MVIVMNNIDKKELEENKIEEDQKENEDRKKDYIK